MREILKHLAPKLRAQGYRGSGQNFRKTDGDFVCVVNFQGSSRGDRFYVNLGAQPFFIPTEGNAELNPKTVKEYECIFRRRVGKEWQWEMNESDRARLEKELNAAQSEFFVHAQTLRTALRDDEPESLLENFCFFSTKARAALHLARGSLALGDYEKAEILAIRGLELAGEGAYILRDELNALINTVRDKAARPSN
jgi:hypothetical protein